MIEQRRIRLTFEYDGARYAGWQLQDNAESIQGVAERALEKIIGHHARINSSGRTDAGVHAFCQPAHADVTTRLADAEITRAMNALLPADIVVKETATVAPDWSARFSATQKTYAYTILNRPHPSALDRGRVWHIRKPLDTAAMQEAARLFVGEHDFSSFRSAGCASKHPVRALTRLDVDTEGDYIRITLTANAFLKQMARNIVGTLVEAGRGRIAVDDVAKILEARDRTKAGPCAPPQGLCLVEVSYTEG